MKIKIKKTYKKPSDTFLLMLVGRIKDSMKNNPYFPNATPTQAEVEKAYVEFQLSLSAAGRYGRTLSSAKNDKKAELIGLLEKLDDHVTTVSNGDKTMLLSSGFDIAGIKGASQELEPIEKLNVEIGPTGQATSRVSKVSGQGCTFTNVRPIPLRRTVYG